MSSSSTASAYKYVPSSSASTRQLIDSTLPVSPTSPSRVAHNSAQHDAAAGHHHNHSIMSSPPQTNIPSYVTQPSLNHPTRPVAPTRKSSNYQDALEAARKATAAAALEAQQSNGGSAGPGGEAGAREHERSRDAECVREKMVGVSSAATWKPSFDRKQSWNREDAKRDLQMSSAGLKEMEGQEIAGLSVAK